MKTAKAFLWIAHYMPEWMFGRVFLAKMAIAYMLINALARSNTLKA